MVEASESASGSDVRESNDSLLSLKAVCSEKVKSGKAPCDGWSAELLFLKNSFKTTGSSRSGSSKFHFSSCNQFRKDPCQVK